jgi:hypothetical protein
MNFKTHKQLLKSLKDRLTNQQGFYRHCAKLALVGAYSQNELSVQFEILKELEKDLNNFLQRTK